jgi:hypothetical protein
MNYTIYEINEYSISISSQKNIIVIFVINNLNNDKHNIRLDKSTDSIANTNCNNNITLDLKTDIYDFIINCLEKKPYYNIKTKLIKSSEQYDDEKDELYLIFSFIYENFNFEYTLNLFTE